MHRGHTVGMQEKPYELEINSHGGSLRSTCEDFFLGVHIMLLTTFLLPKTQILPMYDLNTRLN